MKLTLAVSKRERPADAVRSDGRLPGVVYGPKQEPISLECEAIDFKRLYEQSGESTIVELQGLDEPVEVLVHSIDFNPVKGGPMHVDFYAIERGKDLTTNVALEFEGDAPVEKQGGFATKVLHEVTVTCRPGVLPSHFTVDLTQLDEMDAQITVADLSVPEGVTIDTDPEMVVATVSTATEEPAEPEETMNAADVPTVGGSKEQQSET